MAKVICGVGRSEEVGVWSSSMANVLVIRVMTDSDRMFYLNQVQV